MFVIAACRSSAAPRAVVVLAARGTWGAVRARTSERGRCSPRRLYAASANTRRWRRKSPHRRARERSCRAVAAITGHYWRRRSVLSSFVDGRRIRERTGRRRRLLLLGGVWWLERQGHGADRAVARAIGIVVVPGDRRGWAGRPWRSSRTRPWVAAAAAGPSILAVCVWRRRFRPRCPPLASSTARARPRSTSISRDQESQRPPGWWAFLSLITAPLAFSCRPVPSPTERWSPSPWRESPCTWPDPSGCAPSSVSARLSPHCLPSATVDAASGAHRVWGGLDEGFSSPSSAVHPRFGTPFHVIDATRRADWIVFCPADDRVGARAYAFGLI